MRRIDAGDLPEQFLCTPKASQAEHGGFYQAKATGLYEKAGLDVTIKMGGPQVNALQLLLAGETDIMMGYDIQVLKALEQNIPITTIAASFQFDLQGMMTHEDVSGLDGMKGKTILIAASSRMTLPRWTALSAVVFLLEVSHDK